MIMLCSTLSEQRHHGPASQPDIQRVIKMMKLPGCLVRVVRSVVRSEMWEVVRVLFIAAPPHHTVGLLSVSELVRPRSSQSRPGQARLDSLLACGAGPANIPPLLSSSLQRLGARSECNPLSL